MRRLALKRLTPSDLTFFRWHFENQPAGNQKAINLNADVFIEVLYPGLPSLAENLGGRLPLDLYLYGPGMHGEVNLQRKIIKTGSYKNWRLNGEFIVNPPDDPERFNSLAAGDFVVMEFSGEPVPTAARTAFVAAAQAEDKDLHGACGTRLGTRRMMALATSELDDIIASSNVDDDHPIRNLTLDDALEDAAQGGTEGVRALKRRASGRRVSRGELADARKNADHVGQWGEEFVNDFLEAEATAGRITNLKWVSQENAVASHDFSFTEPDGTAVRLDVKSTRGEFGRVLHVSGAELEDMATFEGRYDLYRVYSLEDNGAQLRIAPAVGGIAQGLVKASGALPDWARVDSLSIRPEAFGFGDASPLTPTPEEES